MFDPVEVIPETVGQYTELRGKNNKKIYGDDILKKPDGTIYLVVWYRGGFMLKEKGKFGHRSIEIYDGDINKYEIIGNRWDNPELLKEARK